MWAPFVKETASAPGTSTTFNLGGASAPFQSFVTGGFTNGATVDGYILQDSSQAEWGFGVFNTGSPNTLTRTTVIGNTAGTTARLNFAGTTAVYCWPIKALSMTGASVIDAMYGDLRNLGAVNGGAVSGVRNRIMNSGFDIWQGGTSFTGLASNTTLADGWGIIFDGSGATMNVYQVDALLYTSQSVLDSGARRYMTIQRTVAGSGGTYAQIYTPIEGVHQLAGKTVVFGAWMRADASRSVTVTASQKMGSGGSPSSDVNTGIATLNLTTSWQWLQGSVALPTIWGKTLGSSGDDKLWLMLSLPVNTTMTIDIARPHLMEGTYLPAAMAEPIEYGFEWRQAHRLRTVLPLGLTGAAHSTTAITLAGRTPVPMRATPSVTWSGTGTAYFPGIGDKTSSNAPTIYSYDASTGGFLMLWDGFTGLTSGAPCIYKTAPTTALLTSSLL